MYDARYRTRQGNRAGREFIITPARDRHRVVGPVTGGRKAQGYLTAGGSALATCEQREDRRGDTIHSASVGIDQQNSQRGLGPVR
jgi:hypothetical protein